MKPQLGVGAHETVRWDTHPPLGERTFVAGATKRNRVATACLRPDS